MKISLVQTNPQQDRPANLAAARTLMDRAWGLERPDIVVLPEYFEYSGGPSGSRLSMAETAPGGTAYAFAQEFAREKGVFVHAGSILERIVGEDRIYNTTFVFDRRGDEIARYRKIHLFDIEGPDGTVYRESDVVRPGADVVTYEVDGFRIGCAICFDLRFADLFLALASANADVIILPAAFTMQTGKDHWEVLCRARAIETQTYIAASAQWGGIKIGSEIRHTYGHSLIVDPWGHVIAQASDGVGSVTGTIERDYLSRVRQQIPMSSLRRLACG